MKCPRCKKEMRKNLTKGIVDIIMKLRGDDTFKHTDWDCFKCGIHATEDEDGIRSMFVGGKGDLNDGKNA